MFVILNKKLELSFGMNKVVIQYSSGICVVYNARLDGEDVVLMIVFITFIIP